MKPARHPMQPVVFDQHGVVRFKANAIVRYLLDNGGIDMNHLALQNFSEEDEMQFAQLIGYSVSGYGDLSYASRRSVSTADRRVEKLLAQKNESAD